jgi:hypothetical protein
MTSALAVSMPLFPVMARCECIGMFHQEAAQFENIMTYIKHEAEKCKGTCDGTITDFKKLQL